MKEIGRLSRRERLKLSGRRRVQFVLALAILLLILLAIRTWRTQLRDIIDPPDYAEIQATADSVILQAGESFVLTDTAYVDSVSNRRNPRREVYVCRRYGQFWPGVLPFEFYVQRLQQLCRENGLACDCEETSENRLDCKVGAHGLDGALVQVKKAARTELKGRRTAILMKNLGALDNDKIMRIAENGIAFSYLATPDVYPSARIKKALEAAGITSILEIPTDISDLPDFQGRASGSRGKPGRRKNRDLAASLFDHHPNPAAIIIDRTGSVDSSFVTAVIEEAKKRKAAYIYDNASPDAIDSLAYSSGLVILNMKNVADFSNGRFDHNRAALLRELILSQEPIQRIILIEGSAVEVGDLLDLQRSFHRLGVKLMNSISLMETRESL